MIFFQTSIWFSVEKRKTWAEPELVQSWAPAGSSGRPWSVSSRETCRAASSPWTPCALEKRGTLTLSLVCEWSCYCHCHICVIVIGPSPSGKRAQQRGQWTGHRDTAFSLSQYHNCCCHCHSCVVDVDVDVKEGSQPGHGSTAPQLGKLNCLQLPGRTQTLLARMHNLAIRPPLAITVHLSIRHWNQSALAGELRSESSSSVHSQKKLVKHGSWYENQKYFLRFFVLIFQYIK